MKRSISVACFVTVLCLAGLTAVTVYAQSYPNKPIQMIISIPAGGGGDVNARIMMPASRGGQEDDYR